MAVELSPVNCQPGRLTISHLHIHFVLVCPRSLRCIFPSCKRVIASPSHVFSWFSPPPRFPARTTTATRINTPLPSLFELLVERKVYLASMSQLIMGSIFLHPLAPLSRALWADSFVLPRRKRGLGGYQRHARGPGIFFCVSYRHVDASAMS